MRAFRIGSRGSKLALWQARHVAEQLGRLYPEHGFEIEVVHTSGDVRTDVPLSAFGDKSLFIKEIESALLSRDIDFAVHSLKDVPSALDSRFALAAILERADPRDVLLVGSNARPSSRRPAEPPAPALVFSQVGAAARDNLAALPVGAVVGTSSLRREAQLRAARPDLRFEPIRGNVDTRLRKLEAGQYDAIVLAAAGLHRLGVHVPASGYLETSISLPAPGQAALCVEAAADNGAAIELVACLDHPTTRRCVEAERAFAAALEAGCEVPLGALATASEQSATWLHLDGMVASTDGRTIVRVSGEGIEPGTLGRGLAERALARGAAALLALAKAR